MASATMTSTVDWQMPTEAACASGDRKPALRAEHVGGDGQLRRVRAVHVTCLDPLVGRFPRGELHELAVRARANSRAICCSLSPYHLLSRSDDLVAMKLAWLSRAQALASIVLPVPGGP